MHLISLPCRPRRAGEWSDARAVTFIVTLAATRSVTLAARAAGMSRKSAYALKARSSAFAAAWEAARRAAGARREGNEVEEVEDPPIPSNQGDRRASGSRAAERRPLSAFARHLAELRAFGTLSPPQ